MSGWQHAYFRRFGFCERQVQARACADLGLAVVIPCHDEPDLVGCLEALWRCERPCCAVEVVVVVNASADAPEAVQCQNRKTMQEAVDWVGRHQDPRFAFHLLHFPALPPRHAGVGLARKIGMDEAAGRFADLGRVEEGVIAGFDADCRCSPNYLRSLETQFDRHPDSPGCSVYFEHPLDGPMAPEVQEAGAAYELHLRYYVQGLRFAGYPNAYHTVGSCMAVRAAAYLAQGGMNKRQAGEDFYFLHKIIPLGGFADLTSTTVYPAVRASKRVPFGTGKAVRDYLRGSPVPAYPLEGFRDLKSVLGRLSTAAAGEGPKRWAEGLEGMASEFLEEARFASAWPEIRAHTSTEAAFRKRLGRWFDGFRVMKFMRHAQKTYDPEGRRRIGLESTALLRWLGSTQPAEELPLRGLLEIYRGLGRRSAW